MDTVYLLVNQTPQNSTETNKSEYVPKKIWTTEMEKDFIKLIKEERGLWEINNEMNKKRSYRFHAWDKIVRKMTELWPKYEYLFTPIKLIKKFRNFRTYFVREQKKLKRNSNYVSRWMPFEDLQFLEGNYYTKQEYIQATHSPPVIIQFSDGNRKSLKNVIKENLRNSSVNGKINASKIEDPMCNEGESSEAFYANVESSYSDVEEMSPMPKKKQSMAQCVSNSADFFNSAPKHQKYTMTHDEAFANFIAHDLGNIPEGRQKEKLRFKIVELIHQCKMDTSFLED